MLTVISYSYTVTAISSFSTVISDQYSVSADRQVQLLDLVQGRGKTGYQNTSSFC